MAGKRSRVVHRTRPEVSSRLAVLVTVRIREGLPSLRKRETFGVLEKAFIKGKERLGLRLLHFSVLSNHMHFLVEARNKDALTLGMQGLSIRIAKASIDSGDARARCLPIASIRVCFGPRPRSDGV